MSEKEEREIWEKSIKPNNSRIQLILSKLRWKFYLAGAWIKRRKILGVDDVTWSLDDLYKLVYVMLCLCCISMALNIIMDVLMFIYPSLRWEIFPNPDEGYKFFSTMLRGS